MTAEGTTQEDERAVVTIDGDLVAATVPHWRSLLADLDKRGVRHLVFDLERTTLVDSSGIGLLLAAHNSLTRKGGRIEVTGASPDVAGLFRAMRLDKHFTVSARGGER